MANRLPFSREQYFNSARNESFSGSHMFTFNTGLNTNRTTWPTPDETGPAHSNPIVADSNGIFPEIFGTGKYKIRIFNQDETLLLFESDPIEGVPSTANIENNYDSVESLKKSGLVVGAVATTSSYFVNWESSLNGPVGQGKYDITTKATHDTVRGTGTVDGLGDHTLDNGNIALLRNDDTVNPYQFGATGGGDTSTQEVIAAFNREVPVAINDHFAISGDYIQFTKPNTVIWGPNGEIEQKLWDYPAFHVKAPNCAFIGQANITNNATPFLITASNVPEIDADFKQSAAGILCQGTDDPTTRADDFSFDRINTFGFVAGLVWVGANTGVNKTFRMSGNHIHGEMHDFVCFGAGFNGVDINVVSGKDIRNTQDEPEHLIYATGAVADRSDGLRINRAICDGIEFGTHALLLKSTSNFRVDFVDVINTAGAISVFESNGSFGKIEVTASQVAADMTDTGRAVINNFGNSNVRYDEAPLITSTNAGVLFQVDEGSVVTCNGFEGTIDNVAPTNPVKVRGGATLIMTNKPTVTYIQTQPALPHAAFLAEEANTQFQLFEPGSNADRVVRMQQTGTGDYILVLNQDLYPYSTQEFVASGIVAKAQFTGKAANRAVIADGTSAVKIRAQTTLETNNTSARTITSFDNGNPNQEFMVVAGTGDTFTTIQNNANIVLHGGVNLVPGAWTRIKFTYVGGKAIEDGPN